MAALLPVASLADGLRARTYALSMLGGAVLVIGALFLVRL